MNWRILLDELGRRRVYRVSAAYVIAAFALLQGADIVIPALGISPWVMRAIVVVTIAGLPVAAVLAWVFEVTPHGLERTKPWIGGAGAPPQDVPPSLAATAILAVVLASLVLGGAAWWAVRQVTPGLLTGEPEGGSPPRAASVAVLPCIDVSAGRGHEYFGDGITEEIIGELARFEGLKVISRTSVAALKESRLTLPQIADTLGVDHVLECSVQRSGSRVRVRATLVDPHSDTQLWADAFDRELTDVVAMQEDIARHVGAALHARLPRLRPRTSVARAPTPAAYDAYLRATAARRNLSRASLVAATAAFEEAIEADPSFAAAYSGLAQVHVVWTLFGYSGDDPYARVAAAFDLAERALALDSTLADAYGARGHAGLRAWLPGEDVLADFDRAIALAPGSGELRLFRGIGLAFAGRIDEAVLETEAAIALDPLAPGHHDFRAMSLVLARRYEEALRSARLARALAPDFPNPIRQEARSLLLLGRFDECATMDIGPYLALRAMCLHSLGHVAQAAALIDSFAAVSTRPTDDDAPFHGGGIAADIAEYHAWIGDAEGTIRWLRRSTEFSPTAQFLVYATATYDRISGDPVFRTGFDRIRRDVRHRVESLRAASD